MHLRATVTRRCSHQQFTIAHGTQRFSRTGLDPASDACEFPTGDDTTSLRLQLPPDSTLVPSAAQNGTDVRSAGCAGHAHCAIHPHSSRHSSESLTPTRESCRGGPTIHAQNCKAYPAIRVVARRSDAVVWRPDHENFLADP